MGIPEWTVGERMRKAREDARLTQAEMAEKLGVTKNTVGSWEKMKHQPVRGGGFLQVVQRWGEITNVEPSWILGLSRTATSWKPETAFDLRLDLDWSRELVAA